MKALLSTVALLAFTSAAAVAQVQVDKSKTLGDFTGNWDGFSCLTTSKPGAPKTTDAWRLSVQPAGATLTEANLQTHPFSGSASVDGGVLTVEYVNGPEFETQMKESIKVAFYVGQSKNFIAGEVTMTYLGSGETHGPNMVMAIRSDPKQSLADFAKKYADQCAHIDD